MANFLTKTRAAATFFWAGWAEKNGKFTRKNREILQKWPKGHLFLMKFKKVKNSIFRRNIENGWAIGHGPVFGNF